MNYNDPFGSKAFAKNLARESKAMSKSLSINPLGNQSKIKERDNQRNFSKTIKNHVWNNQNGKCKRCEMQLKPSSTHYDHIIAWEDNGQTNESNCQALCANCHSDKTNDDRLKKQKKKRTIKPQQGFGWGI